MIRLLVPKFLLREGDTLEDPNAAEWAAIFNSDGAGQP